MMDRLTDDEKEEVGRELSELNIGDSYQISTAEFSTFTYRVDDKDGPYVRLNAWLH
jgi:hypothetical protein